MVFGRGSCRSPSRRLHHGPRSPLSIVHLLRCRSAR
jgi:hypothetical protein